MPELSNSIDEAKKAMRTIKEYKDALQQRYTDLRLHMILDSASHASHASQRKDDSRDYREAMQVLDECYSVMNKLNDIS